MPRTLARLLALGALAVSGGIALVFALLVYITLPTQFSGIDRTQAIVTWIACGGAALGLIAVHLAMARQLWSGPVRNP